MPQAIYELRVQINKKDKPTRFKLKGKRYYQMFLSIKSTDDEKLAKVLYAKYLLHKSFKNRERISSNRDNNFSVEILAWGIFEVQVILGLEDGKEVTFTQHMRDVIEDYHK